MCFTVERTFPAELASVARARRFTSAFVVSALHPAGWHVVDDATLLVSELVTTALQRGADRVTVRVDAHFDRIEITVTAGDVIPVDVGWLETSDVRARIVEDLTGDFHTCAVDGEVSTASLPCPPAHARGIPCSFR